MVTLDKTFTAEGSPNIALIKYWGKRNERLILPHNSSLSITFDHKALRTVTSVMFSKRLKKDIFYLDGKKQDLDDKDIKERFSIVEKMRRMAKTDARVIVVSQNYFPTARGLASSASGIATLVYVINKALGLGLDAKEMSVIARQGSGSASRSMFGGVVVWNKGKRGDGRDSFAEQIFKEDYWPQLIDNIVVVSTSKKKVPSRAGMRTTANTNPLFKQRSGSAESRLAEIKRAFKAKDISKVAECTIADSNEMHALMLSTVPSIRYLNAASYAIMDAIEGLNAMEGKTIAGYTFDAGPNANIITINKYQGKVTKVLSQLKKRGMISYVKTSRLGEGPRMLPESKSLIKKSMLGR